MPASNAPAPDNTAIRTALWRALHTEIDASPHVFEDTVGLAIAAPDDDWRKRPEMGDFTRRVRASIVARARFIEDLVAEEARSGVAQYVILGAGLDTFAQRRADLAAKVKVFEVDQPGPQAWKRQRLEALGFGVPAHLALVPVDFEAGVSWKDEIVRAGFDATKPAVVTSTGVSMYLTRDAVLATMRDVATLAKGSSFAMTFLQPSELVEESERPMLEIAKRGAAAAGTPFVSFFSPQDVMQLAFEAGFDEVKYVSAAELNARYFAGRKDGLTTSNGEEIIVART